MSALDRTPFVPVPKSCPECSDRGFITLDGEDIACPWASDIPQPTEWDQQPASRFWLVLPRNELVVIALAIIVALVVLW